TTAIRDGENYVINAQKTCISNTLNAHIFILAAKSDPSARGKGVSLLIVEINRPGFKLGRPLHKIGSKAMDTSELFFDDLRVPTDNLLGVEGNGFLQLVTALAQERLLQAIRSTAASEAALQWTVAYTSERQAFGKRLA